MTGRWTLPALTTGEVAPDFCAVTRLNPRFHFTTTAGRYVLLGFMPRDPGRRAAALAAVEAIQPRFDDRFLSAFFVASGPDLADIPADRIPGQRWFFDAEAAIAPSYDLGPDGTGWLLFDPALRLMERAPIDQSEALFARIAGLPPLGELAGGPMVAPALIVPRVFEPEFSRRLIEVYATHGGLPSGVMRDIDGRTVGVLDQMKSRRDVQVADPDLRREIVARIERSLIPMINRAFHFKATRIERYTIACYDAAEGGFFRPHRDNETLATAHRRFACSINLNAEDFEGGDLRFPEFGPRTYRPPTGGAVVFACNLLHEATPVARGRRYAFLPFFYDEEGQRIRERNSAFPDVTPPMPPEAR